MNWYQNQREPLPIEQQRKVTEALTKTKWPCRLKIQGDLGSQIHKAAIGQVITAFISNCHVHCCSIRRQRRYRAFDSAKFRHARGNWQRGVGKLQRERKRETERNGVRRKQFIIEVEVSRGERRQTLIKKKKNETKSTWNQTRLQKKKIYTQSNTLEPFFTLMEIQGPLRRKMWPVRLVLRWCTFMPSRHHELTACTCGRRYHRHRTHNRQKHARKKQSSHS